MKMYETHCSIVTGAFILSNLNPNMFQINTLLSKSNLSFCEFETFSNRRNFETEQNVILIIACFDQN
jgi:hypothetical protein